ncbi:MAG: hypothetical protein R2710_25830 [Acidimicrobiales bacterium]
MVEALTSDQVVVAFEAAAQRVERAFTDHVKRNAPPVVVAGTDGGSSGHRTTLVDARPQGEGDGPYATERSVATMADLDAVVADLRALIEGGKTVTLRWETDPS